MRLITVQCDSCKREISKEKVNPSWIPPGWTFLEATSVALDANKAINIKIDIRYECLLSNTNAIGNIINDKKR